MSNEFELLETVITQLPNVAGLFIVIIVQWRMIKSLLDYIRSCDCKSRKPDGEPYREEPT